jgi:hypothetical protein
VAEDIRLWPAIGSQDGASEIRHQSVIAYIHLLQIADGGMDFPGWKNNLTKCAKLPDAF